MMPVMSFDDVNQRLVVELVVGWYKGIRDVELREEDPQ
jgi:hypothetical protein